MPSSRRTPLSSLLSENVSSECPAGQCTWRRRPTANAERIFIPKCPNTNPKAFCSTSRYVWNHSGKIWKYPKEYAQFKHCRSIWEKHLQDHPDADIGGEFGDSDDEYDFTTPLRGRDESHWSPDNLDEAQDRGHNNEATASDSNKNSPGTTYPVPENEENINQSTPAVSDGPATPPSEPRKRPGRGSMMPLGIEETRAKQFQRWDKLRKEQLHAQLEREEQLKLEGKWKPYQPRDEGLLYPPLLVSSGYSQTTAGNTPITSHSGNSTDLVQQGEADEPNDWKRSYTITLKDARSNYPQYHGPNSPRSRNSLTLAFAMPPPPPPPSPAKNAKLTAPSTTQGTKAHLGNRRNEESDSGKVEDEPDELGTVSPTKKRKL